MPAPALLGLPALYAGIVALVTSFVNFLVKYMGKRLAFLALGIGMITACLGAFILAMEVAVNAIAVGVPPQATAAASWVLPTNTLTVPAAIAAARLARYGLDWKIRFIQHKMRV